MTSKKVEPKRRRHTGRYEFFSNIERIRKLYSDGMTVIMIWEKLREEGVVTISYQHFALYVREHLQKVGTETAEPKTPKGKQSTNGRSEDSHTPSAEADIKGFGFKPYDPKDKDELI